MMLETMTGLARIGLQKWIVDDVMLGGMYEKLPYYLILFGFSLVLPPLLFTLNAMLHHVLGHNLRVELGRFVLSRLQHIPIGVFQNERVTRFVDYINRDVDVVGENVSYQIPKGFQQIFTALLLIVAIGYISPLILIAITTVSVSYIALGRYFASRVRATAREVQDHKTELLVHIEEGISSTREVIAFHRQVWEMRIYDKLFKQYFDKVMEEGRLVNLQLLLSDPLRWSSDLIVLIYGGYQVVQGSMTAGELLVLFQFSHELSGTYQQIFRYYMEGASTLACIDRIRTVTDSEQILEGTLQLNGRLESLQLRDIEFRYEEDSTPVLKRLSLDIMIGSKLAIVGTSGGGKSTISKLLIRYYEPTSGNILVNGTPLSQITRHSWALKVTITAQEPYMFPDTIRNNITFGRSSVSEEQLISICKQMCIHDDICSLPNGYDEEIGERGVTMSGGQRQRIALARALLCDPEVLILDEATSALDLETERQIQRNLDDMRQGRTTIIIAHRLSTVQNADLICVMDRGEIAEQGTHMQLMALQNSLYKRLVLAQEEQSRGYSTTIFKEKVWPG